MADCDRNMTTPTTSADCNINLMKWEHVKRLLSRNHRSGVMNVSPTDVFRITKMAYRNNYLLVFLTGYLSDDAHRVFQGYVEVKCDLYSYQFCYNNHVFDKCRNSCKSYKAFVMPGVRNVQMDRFNVIKFKCTSNDLQSTSSGGGVFNLTNSYRSDTTIWKKKPLDYFLRDVNRVHMQTDLKEGQYVRFTSKQTFVNHRLKCNSCVSDLHKRLFEIVPVEKLTRKIVPVVVCFDIETHSNGQKFSNSLENHIMSISMVMRRDDTDTKLCLYYLANKNEDDVPKDGVESLTPGIAAIRFDTELDMLSAFFELWPLLNADYVLDYNGDKFDLPFILDRVKYLKAPIKGYGASAKRVKTSAGGDDCTKIRRYDLQPIDIETQVLHDKFGNKVNNHLFTYYVHVDLYQFLSSDSDYKNLENYQLNTVAEHYLKRTKVDLSIAEMLRLYNANCVKKMIEYNIQDSVLPIDLLLKLEIMDFLYTQCMLLYLCTDDLLSNISHKISVVFFNLCLTNTTTNSEGAETLDPFIFNKNDLSITSGRQSSGVIDLSSLKRKPVPRSTVPADAVKLCSTRPVCNYKGGKVLSPRSGLKTWVVTLDFNSLYPTIMMYEGVCFSNLFITDDNCVYLHKNMDAINPKLLRNLMTLRQKYKNMRDMHPVGSFVYNLYDTLQNAVKRIANSIYGYFGIYFKVLANYVTKMGRTKLIEAVKLIEAMSDDADIKREHNLSTIKFKVIYGDTDSSFIQVDFDENEIAPHLRFETIKNIIQNGVLARLNGSWDGKGYKMALENVMSSLILLKKKKYCYLNSEGRIKYKGWLIKKDMPLFMRKTFRAVVDSFLYGHSVACGLHMMHTLMMQYYKEFGRERDRLIDYSFSMSYNENSTTAKKNKKKEATSSESKPAVVTIAKHCRELLLQSGVKSLPGIGDRIPFLLVDIKGKITQKTYPLALFDPSNPTIRVSWIKHMNILCNFMNELIQVFGDDMPELQHYFTKICSLYMSAQMHDVKYPALAAAPKTSNKSKSKKQTLSDGSDNSDEDHDTDVECDDGECDSDRTFRRFKMYVRKPAAAQYNTKNCVVCNKMC
ncbi:DNA polymerase [Orgyia leucostigma nucleopolyhedrovirus]|uniref:DNA-directed DNA polymerase n=1 Tax=Orgyia leucostigma nucleopolyhedrovirus TaxID=490711 RepID=B0FDT5_9ABAC|nr:DNA polymerase [Orgyia leucostigma nucleopolyhedrovirus]ABY65793.1 DNA polymerase [Orgyia leucostigma nucleopolyhedrovirus]